MIYIACKQIVDEIHKDFKKTYMGVRTSGEIWDECMKAVNNPKLMNDIIYNNDDSGIPPVETFLASNTTLIGGFSDYEKRCIGAFWGFVFKFVFKCRTQIKNTPINIKGIDTASLYKDPVDDITVY